METKVSYTRLSQGCRVGFADVVYWNAFFITKDIGTLRMLSDPYKSGLDLLIHGHFTLVWAAIGTGPLMAKVVL